MNKKIILTKGLPASGKSTWAKEQTKLGFKRINKDDLRAMLDNSLWSKSNEKFIIKTRNALVKLAIESGHSVIVDDTNLHPSHETSLIQLAVELGCAFEVKSFLDVPLEVCLERDKKRPNYVGEAVIKRMYREHLSTPSPAIVPINPVLRNCIIVDVDGTIANNTGVRDWMDFQTVYKDAVKKEVLEVIDAFCLKHNPKIFIFSGRENTGLCFGETARWLNDKVFPDFPNFAKSAHNMSIVMRDERDYRKDAIVKQEMYDASVKGKFNVLAVFDDRNQVVDMWRSLGLQVFQVAEGSF